LEFQKYNVKKRRRKREKKKTNKNKQGCINYIYIKKIQVQN